MKNWIDSLSKKKHRENLVAAQAAARPCLSGRAATTTGRPPAKPLPTYHRVSRCAPTDRRRSLAAPLGSKDPPRLYCLSTTTANYLNPISISSLSLALSLSSESLPCHQSELMRISSYRQFQLGPPVTERAAILAGPSVTGQGHC